MARAEPRPVCGLSDDRIEMQATFGKDNLYSAKLSYPDAYPVVLERDVEHEKDMYMYDVFVKPVARRRGIATRLISAAGYVAKKHGYQNIRVSTGSQHILKSIGNAFGVASISYFDHVPGTNETVELPLSYEQAYASLKQAEQFEDNLEERAHAIILRINLGATALDRLEAPVMTSARPDWTR